MASSCIACCILHNKNIPFKCSGTALTVAEAMNGAKVKSFVFRHVCFVSQIWRQNSSPGSVAFSHLGNRAEISHMKAKFIPVNGLMTRGPKNGYTTLFAIFLKR